MSAIEDVLREVERLEAATPKGPWSHSPSPGSPGQSDAVVAFCAASRTLLPRLAKALQIAVEGLEQLTNCHRSQNAYDTENAADNLLAAIEAVLKGDGE